MFLSIPGPRVIYVLSGWWLSSIVRLRVHSCMPGYWYRKDFWLLCLAFPGGQISTRHFTVMWVAAQFLLSIQWLQACLTYTTTGICRLCLCNISVIFSVTYHGFALSWFLYYCIMAMSLSLFFLCM